MNEPMPFFLMGMMLGAICTLMVQWYGRRKAHQAVSIVPDANRAVTLLANENEQQKHQIGRLEERISVMERIATDPAERVHREIEHLRLGGN